MGNIRINEIYKLNEIHVLRQGLSFSESLSEGEIFNLEATHLR